MEHYRIKDIEHYHRAYKEAKDNPEKFWEDMAEDHFLWRKKWDEVLEYDFSKPEIKWFKGAKLNITENCIDRHLEKRGDKTALLWVANDPKEAAQHITYRQLYHKVNQMANVLKSIGVSKGDRVCLYLPMIPELAYAVLACARIGAIHSVVFAGFSSKALATRINDCECDVVITSDGSYRGEKVLNLKEIVDESLNNCPRVKKVLVVKRTNNDIQMVEGRDQWLAPLIEKASTECPAEEMDAEDILFILYTSGSTGDPKGMVHSTAGYMIYAAYTFNNIFRCEEEDVYWCTADIGWITGHSYIIYGPLTNGATSLMFEGVPSYPDYGRFWQIVQDYKVNQFYTAPTAIRSLEKRGDAFPNKYDLSSLKVLGSVGEPINDEAWQWYHTQIGKGKCPIADTWWQTETGGFMISPIPEVIEPKPTFAMLPLPGVQVALMNEDNEEIHNTEELGRLCITYPWPSIARTIWKDHKRYHKIYFSTFKDKYFSGDGAFKNEDGYYRITGRVDDVIIVSGHNLGTAPIEDAIDEHHLIIEAAVVGYPHDLKGNALYGFLTSTDPNADHDVLRKEVNDLISKKIGPIAKLDKIQFVSGLPKTRSGKIMRRILKKIVLKDTDNLGDVSTLLNPEVVESIVKNAL